MAEESLTGRSMRVQQKGNRSEAISACEVLLIVRRGEGEAFWSVASQTVLSHKLPPISLHLGLVNIASILQAARVRGSE